MFAEIIVLFSGCCFCFKEMCIHIS